MSEEAQPLSIPLADGQAVSGLLQMPRDARACYVMAHGAGAGMAHPFMTAFADDLASHSIATLRYQFPYMERGSKRPDSPKVAHATVRAAVAEALRRAPGLALFAGGRSFGGRMTSQAQAASPLPGVCGLAFVGFRCTPRVNRRTSVPCTSRTCRFRCFSCRGRATSSPTCRFLRVLRNGSERVPRSRSSTKRITPSTCRRERDARTRTSAPKWRMRWRAGSRRSREHAPRARYLIVTQ